jgi:hypothetical protein
MAFECREQCTRAYWPLEHLAAHLIWTRQAVIYVTLQNSRRAPAWQKLLLQKVEVLRHPPRAYCTSSVQTARRAIQSNHGTLCVGVKWSGSARSARAVCFQRSTGQADARYRARPRSDFPDYWCCARTECRPYFPSHTMSQRTGWSRVRQHLFSFNASGSCRVGSSGADASF